MLKGLPKILSPELLKILCEMGHGDEIVIADANFPSETFGKRVVRKFLKWYIEPICFQQTEFNNAVTPSIGRLTEIVRELLNREGQKQQAIQETIQRMNHAEASYQSLHAVADENIKTAHQRMDQMESGYRALQESTAANLAAAMQHMGQLEEQQNHLNDQIHANQAFVIANQQQLSDACGRTDEQVGKLQQELQCVLAQSEAYNRTLQDQVNTLHRDLAELRTMLDFKTAAIHKLESDMGCVRDVDPEIFRGSQQSFFDKRTTSQSGEDSIVAYVTMVLGIRPEDVTYLDLGANHAKELSNTYYFYQRGARGVLVEANPELIPELKLMRHGDQVVNRCVSDVDGKTVEFYVLNEDGLSTCSSDSVVRDMAANPELSVAKTVEVETITVNTVMEQYFHGAPVLLNVDIEGNDMEVLRAMDFDRYRPLVIVAEAIPYAAQLVVGKKNKELVAFMEERDYVEYAFTGINAVFLDRKQLEGRALL